VRLLGFELDTVREPAIGLCDRRQFIDRLKVVIRERGERGVDGFVERVLG
jgi:hypothetical protein